MAGLIIAAQFDAGPGIVAVKFNPKTPEWVERVHFGLWLQADMIIDCQPEPLFAAQIPFGCFHRDVPQEELNLFQLATGNMA